MKSNEYRCAECDGVFQKAWTDEEAAAEYEEAFPDEADAPAVVCDDCYRALTGR